MFEYVQVCLSTYVQVCLSMFKYVRLCSGMCFQMVFYRLKACSLLVLRYHKKSLFLTLLVLVFNLNLFLLSFEYNGNVFRFGLDFSLTFKIL